MEVTAKAVSSKVEANLNEQSGFSLLNHTNWEWWGMWFSHLCESVVLLLYRHC